LLLLLLLLLLMLLLLLLDVFGDTLGLKLAPATLFFFSNHNDSQLEDIRWHGQG
jgi:hypothetical protein